MRLFCQKPWNNYKIININHFWLNHIILLFLCLCFLLNGYICCTLLCCSASFFFLFMTQFAGIFNKNEKSLFESPKCGHIFISVLTAPCPCLIFLSVYNKIFWSKEIHINKKVEILLQVKVGPCWLFYCIVPYFCCRLHYFTFKSYF